MGVNFIDFDTIMHFFGGFLSRLVIFPNKRILSYIISFGIHIFIELIEHKYNLYTGKHLESNINSIFDMLFFTIGFIIADNYYQKGMLKLTGTSYYIGLSILIISILAEILREIFPYSKLVRGAFT